MEAIFFIFAIRLLFQFSNLLNQGYISFLFGSGKGDQVRWCIDPSQIIISLRCRIQVASVSINLYFRKALLPALPGIA